MLYMLHQGSPMEQRVFALHYFPWLTKLTVSDPVLSLVIRDKMSNFSLKSLRVKTYFCLYTIKMKTKTDQGIHSCSITHFVIWDASFNRKFKKNLYTQCVLSINVICNFILLDGNVIFGSGYSVGDLKILCLVWVCSSQRWARLCTRQQ